eukprot:s3485_g7.t1
MGTKLVCTELVCALWSQPDARRVEGHTHLTPSEEILYIHLQKFRDWKANSSQLFFVCRSHFSIEHHAEIAGSPPIL